MMRLMILSFMELKPNSFIKSIIIFNDPNYMVFNKYQMNQAIFKWKTDLAYFYKNNKKSFSSI